VAALLKVNVCPHTRRQGILSLLYGGPLARTHTRISPGYVRTPTGSLIEAKPLPVFHWTPYSHRGCDRMSTKHFPSSFHLTGSGDAEECSPPQRASRIPVDTRVLECIKMNYRHFSFVPLRPLHVFRTLLTTSPTLPHQ